MVILSTFDLDPIIRVCTIIGIIPAIIVAFLVCTWEFYYVLRENDKEYIPLALVFSLVAGTFTLAYISFLVITIPITIFIGSAYFIALKLNKYQISISKNNEDKTT